MRIFDMDNPVMRFLSLLSDVLIISLLWLATSLPVVTIGASTSAAYFLLTRRISNREGYLLRDYFTAFKTNFVTATLAFLTLAAAIALSVFNITVSEAYGNFNIIAMPLNFLLAAESLFVFIHVFPMASRFDMKYRQLMKTAFLVANRHLLTTVLLVILFAAIILATYIFPFFVTFAIGTYCWLSSYPLIRIYRKYRPEMDKDVYE